MSAGYLIVGRVRKPHGMHGELLVEPLSDEPQAVFAPGQSVFIGDVDGNVDESGAGARAATVTRGRPFKDGWLVTLDAVAGRDAAEAMRARYLLCPAADRPAPEPGEVWLHELAGMRVVGVDAAAIGEVADVYNTGAGVLLEVRREHGTVMIPFVSAIVVGVDRDARTLTVDPPAGLLDL